MSPRQAAAWLAKLTTARVGCMSWALYARSLLELVSVPEEAQTGAVVVTPSYWDWAWQAQRGAGHADSGISNGSPRCWAP
jgi:hypothetical protein